MRRLLVVLLVVLSCGACGGGGDDGGGEAGGGGSATTTVAAAPGATKPGAKEVPQFIGEFDRVCTTQVGFPGVAAYEPTPGVHPVVFFDDFRGEGFVHSSSELPGGWSVTQDTNFEDNSELAAAQLVACADRLKETPTGIKCELDDDGKKVVLELVDSVYEVKVYAAATGELKHQQTLEAKGTKCPIIATFKEGDTTYVNEPSDDDYTNALKPVVAPG